MLDILRKILVGASDDTDRIRLAIGRQEARAVRAATYASIQESEFQVFSQWGEDGIIQYLLGKVPIENRVFVEIGVGSYSESNTRFLLCHDNWRGLIIDSGSAHARFVSRRGLDWKYDLSVISSFVTRENIDDLIRGAGVQGDIGLLSIDIDGNDYWVFEAVLGVSPRIVIVEYNSHFGPDHAITIPYRRDFRRGAVHWSNMYFGASLAALCELGARRGYVFVGSNSAGNNAFFVRKELAAALPVLTAREGWVASRFRESRDRDGRLSFVSAHEDRLRLISDLRVVEVPAGATRTIAEVFGHGASARVPPSRAHP